MSLNSLSMHYSSFIAFPRALWKYGILGGSFLLMTLASGLGAVLSESFTSPVGELPFGWTYVIGTNSNSSAAIGQNPNGLLFQRAASGGANSNGVVFYTGSSENISEGIIQGYFSAQISFTLSGVSLGDGSSQGIILGASQQNYDATGIYVGFFASGSNRGLGIWSNPTGNNNPGTQLDFSAFTANLARDTTYILELSVSGNVLSASIRTNDAIPQQIASVSASDVNIAAGYFGIRTAYANTSVATTFSDLTLSVIPEVGTLPLMGVGIGSLFLLGVRRRIRPAGKFVDTP